VVRHHNAVTTSMVVGLLSLCATTLPGATTKQPLTPEACTAMRYLASDDVTDRSALVLSPDGSQVAYVVQAPDLEANDNREELYIAAVDGTSKSPLSPIMSGQVVAAVRWFPDGRSLAALVRRNGKIVLTRIDRTTKAEEIIWEADRDINDYSMNATGETIAIAISLSDSSSSFSSHVQQDGERGYRFELPAGDVTSLRKRKLSILRRVDNHRWKLAQTVEFISPLTGKPVADILGSTSDTINLSPDGRYLLLDNIERFTDIPAGGIWASSRIVNYLKKRGLPFVLVNYLYDLSTKKASIPLASPLVRYVSWASDSKSFVSVALAPAASTWEAADVAKGAVNDRNTHMFAVDVETKKVTEVRDSAERPPIAWTNDGHILLREADGRLSLLQNDGGHWRSASSTLIPLEGLSSYSPIISDGHHVVVEYENAQTAPEIVAIDLSTMEKKTIARLDPQTDDLLLPKSEVVTWTTSTGYKAKGLLLLPPDYDPHRRYPIVIENGSFLYKGEFICDSGTDHVASWPRGILADDGILYLTRFWPGINDWESRYYPKGFPGALAEAAFKQDLIESAVKMLDGRRVIDPQKVALAGFSRGGWYVEYALAHSHLPFRAATATDNFLGSVGEYWLRNGEGQFSVDEGVYGGPPYGESLKSWLNYSISFNFDKIHTPLLTEVMGNGMEDNDRERPPMNLAVHEELLVGLSRLHKPVEFYYYPYEQHQPEHPKARIASLHRNIDWFRFWLQGYERSMPEDADQYKRWDLMRSEFSANKSDGGTAKE
jgi:dipeptidyl aminopeptidase/acylaminoacyl peptidase